MFEKFSKWYGGKNGFIFALCISAALKIILALFNKPFNHDGVLYITAAQHFAEGHFTEGVALYPLPLYSLIITFVHFFVPNWEVAAKLVSITSVVLATIPLYLLTTDLFNRKAAFWACLALAISPLPNDWAVDVIRGPIFVFFVLWAVYFAQNAVKSKKPIFFFLTALFSFFCIFLRIEGIIIIPFFFFFIICLIIKRWKEKVPLIKGILLSVVCLALCMVICFFIVNMSDKAGAKSENIFKPSLPDRYNNILRLEFLDNSRLIYNQLKDMEKNSPFPIGRQNFAEITRHFMLEIYLLGVLQIFIKVLFPPFVIPLFWACRHPFERRHAYVLGLVCCYLGMIYFTLFVRDFMQRRFLFAPVVLLYPWVGLGLERMFASLKHSSMSKVFFPIFLIVFLVSPVFKSIQTVVESDSVTRKAGKWLALNTRLNSATVLTNDHRLTFYAGMKMDECLFYSDTNYRFVGMEKIAQEKQVDIIIIKAPVNNDTLSRHISYYEKIKEFPGRKRDAYIYYSPEFKALTK